ncbi:Uncharacterised protein [Plesiomonas shigelloides]|nr:Uncharacterised protein [Plesiomonas shigelloides]
MFSVYIAMHCLVSIGFRDNKKFKQGHFEMGIRYANFTPISNHFTRRRAPLCPLIKCYQEEDLIYILCECEFC